jgi:hypothetical protein
MGYLDFAKNILLSFILNANDLYFDFYCLDTEIFYSLKVFLSENNRNINLILFDSDTSKRFENYGGREYNKIMGTKTRVILDSLSKNDLIHFVDSDIVFLKPIGPEYYYSYKEYDMVFQQDCSTLEPFALWSCAGNVLIKNTPESHFLLNKVIEYQNIYPNKNDQECMYQYFLDLGIKNIKEYSHAKLYSFPKHEFLNGHNIQDNVKKGMLDNLIIFHANYVVGKHDKIKLFKLVKGWFL